jgi:two-component system sensor histidine kinase KdpD
MRLNQLVENLLDMSRLESGLIKPRLDWCDVGDLLQTVIRKSRKDLADRKIVVRVPDNLPLLRVDFGLMEQALVNLLRNEAAYTPARATIQVDAEVEGQECIITISDDGPGFPPDALPRLFEKFYRVPGSPSGGTGLGLSIARGFIEVHQGSITAGNRATGGAQFTIRLPTTEQPVLQSIHNDGE